MQRANGSGRRGRKEIARQRAGSGECVAVVALALWCAAGIVAVAPARGAEEVDLCPHTPAGAESLVAGCAAVDIAATPDVFYAPALRRLEALREGRRLPAGIAGDFRKALAAVRTARAHLANSRAQLESGLVCRAARTFGRATAKLEEAEASMDAAIDARKRLLVAGRTPGDDVGRPEMEIARLTLARSLALDAFAEVSRARTAVDAACGAVAGDLARRAVVARVHDARHTLELHDGTVLAVPPIRGPAVYQGQTGSFSGVAFADGTGIAVAVEDLGEVTVVDPALLGPCLLLRIAPLQPEPPGLADPWTLHHIGAYEKNDVLHVERGTRFAVEYRSGCKPKKGKPEYRMKLEAVNPNHSSTITSSLKPGNQPVGLPTWVEPEDLVLGVALVTTLQTLTCKTKFNPVAQKVIKTCTQPVDVATKNHFLHVAPDGWYAAASYDETSFALRDNGVAGDWLPAFVSGLETDPLLDGTAPGFAARARKITNGSPSLAYVPISGGEPFAVHEYGAPVIEAKVVGQRNGRTYWYGARVPAVVRDKIADCPVDQGAFLPQGPDNPDGVPSYPTYPPAADYQVQDVGDSFYELPFAPGVAPGKGLMNIDEPNPPKRHPEWQAYALDLNQAEGTKLRAARSGKVVDVVEDDPWNWNDPNMPADWPGIGNYFWVEHEDGSRAVYFHIQLDQVFPEEYDPVARGEEIARVGQTGNASGPHVHFEVVASPEAGGMPLRIRFDAQIGAQADSCYVPRAADAFLSTNG